MIDEHGQSDGGIVPQKSPHKPQGAEGIEGRPPVKGKAQEPPSPRMQSRTSGMQRVLERIRQSVRREKEAKLTSLYYHVYNVRHLRYSVLCCRGNLPVCVRTASPKSGP